MEKFLKNSISFLFPLLVVFFIILGLYFVQDPFKVLRSYNDYSNPYVVPNRDHISTTVFLKNYKKYNYNSFVFGSSRTLAFKPESWSQYINEEDSKVFMFDASGESIYGIYTKIKFLDSLNIKLNNVLLILCSTTTFNNDANHTGHLGIKHYAVSGESMYSYHGEFVKAYFNPLFLFSYLSFKIYGKYKPSMNGYIENRGVIYDTITNKMSLPKLDKEIESNPNEYYLKNDKIFYKRGIKEQEISVITVKHRKMIAEIRAILEKHKSNYKVIITPLYDQVKLSPNDLLILNNEFGSKVHDYSGINSYTNNIKNYYETSHFMPHVGDSILKDVYKK